MADRNLTLVLKAKDEAAAALTKLTGQMNNVEKAANGINKAFRGLQILGLSVGVGALGKFAADSIKAASNIEESMNKIRVVFGEASTQITDFAQNSAQALGQSRLQALEAAGGFGNMFRTIGLTSDAAAGMSIKMVQLASDMASFQNEDPSDMLIRLRAGLAGEAEPLRRFGVLLSEAAVKAQAVQDGIAKAGAELTEAQKVQARYNLILAQTVLQQGDFVRTSDGLANSQRILSASIENTQANIGRALIPALTELLPVIKNVIFAFEDGSKILPETVVRIKTLVLMGFEQMKTGIHTELLQALAAAIDVFSIIKLKAADLAETLANLFDAIRFAPGGIGQAAGGLADLLNPLTDGMRDTESAAGDLRAEVDRLNAESKERITDLANTAQADLDNLAVQVRATGVALGGPSPNSLAAGAKKAEEAIEVLLARALALRDAMPAIREMVAGGDLMAAAQALAALGQSNAQAVNEVLGIQDDIAREAKRALEEAAREAERLAEEARRAAEEIERAFQSAAETMSDSMINALKEGRDVADGTALYFRDVWLKGMEDDITKASREIQDAMRQGLDAGPIFARNQELFAAYMEAHRAMAEEMKRTALAADFLGIGEVMGMEGTGAATNRLDQLRRDQAARADQMRKAGEDATRGTFEAFVNLTRNENDETVLRYRNEQLKTIRLVEHEQLASWYRLQRAQRQREDDIRQRNEDIVLGRVRGRFVDTDMSNPLAQRLLAVLEHLAVEGVRSNVDGVDLGRQVGRSQIRRASVFSAMGGGV